MNKIISIKTDNPALYGLLNSDLPYGVQIISERPYIGSSLDITLTTDIEILADLEAIEKDNFVAWLINRARVLKGKHKININRKQISVNDPEAVEIITKEIENEE